MLSLLILSLAGFGVLHILPALPQLKGQIAGMLGKAYGPIYGLASLVLFVLVVWCFRQTVPQGLYEVATFGRHANFGFSLIGFLFLGVFLCRGSWRNVVRHPMALAVFFWAAGHLLANGDVGTTVLFGGLMAIAGLHAILRQRQPLQASPGREGHNLLSMFVGVALYGLAIQLHPLVAGVAVVSLR